MSSDSASVHFLLFARWMGCPLHALARVLAGDKEGLDEGRERVLDLWLDVLFGVMKCLRAADFQAAAEAARAEELAEEERLPDRIDSFRAVLLGNLMTLDPDVIKRAFARERAMADPVVMKLLAAAPGEDAWNITAAMLLLLPCAAQLVVNAEFACGHSALRCVAPDALRAIDRALIRFWTDEDTDMAIPRAPVFLALWSCVAGVMDL